jgi:hypothetical protein
LLGTSLLHGQVASDSRNIANGFVVPDEGSCDQPYVVVTNDGSWPVDLGSTFATSTRAHAYAELRRYLRLAPFRARMLLAIAAVALPLLAANAVAPKITSDMLQ